MKYITLLFLTLISISAFSQSTNDTVEYVDIILDGKPGYMNVNTGEFVTTIPQSVIDRLSVVKSSPNSQNSVSKSVETGFDMDASTHVVSKGETLYSISKKYGTTVAALKDLNPDISINSLGVNQIINVRKNTEQSDTINITSASSVVEVIKADAEINNTELDTTTEKDSNIYVVQKGETLYSISRKFNLSVNELKSKNNLTSNELSIGQLLIVN